jgi:RNA polymerase sigma-70 factor (ECF subfamily)
MFNLTDGELMRLIRSRRQEALEQLYDRYARLVYSFAKRAASDESLAREIVQLVFARLWTTKAEYDPGKGAFVSWILTITRNIAIDVVRRERKASASAVSIENMQESGLPDSHNDPEREIIRRMEATTVAEAARKLTPPQQRVIELLYWKGFTLQEIAEMGGEPVGTVKSRLHQALKTLRIHLQGLKEER